MLCCIVIVVVVAAHLLTLFFSFVRFFSVLVCVINGKSSDMLCIDTQQLKMEDWAGYRIDRTEVVQQSDKRTLAEWRQCPGTAIVG